MSGIWNMYPRSIRVLAVVAAMTSTGMACIWPLVTIYIHDYLGQPLTVAGLLLLLNQGANLVGSVAGGILFDRWGHRRTFAVGSVGAIAVSVALGLTTDFTAYTVLLLLNGFFFGTIFPVLNALAVRLWPEGGRRGLNVIYVALNIGVAVGSALCGVLASVSFAWTFFGNAIAQAVTLAMFLRCLPQHLADQPNEQVHAAESAETEAKQAAAGTNHRPVAWGALAVLCSGLLVCWIVYVQWTTVLSAYMQTLGISLRQYSLLWTLNGALILFGQPLISWIINSFARTLKAQLLLGGYVFALSMLILSQSTAYAGFVAAMFVMTIGEMLVWPAVPTIAADLAPAGREGMVQGIVSGIASAGRMAGPLVGAMAFEALAPQGMLYLMAVLALVAVGCFAAYSSFVKRTETQPAVSVPEK
ncbi:MULTISPECIES: MFS transporter [Bacillales]|jgi:MFS family permease|uniref:MDR family MFS transporter n=1 Tax=Brevibacillus TaxID=55080 RepID=UPI000E372CA0|nr:MULTISPECIES: MFS transporter [Bacillales]REK61256.1 MAG: MFS transporter [Brevibacillus sp.]MBR8660937.1 MFS transporter [Brevibacillus sp. NL20B1]MDT3416966.1 MFS family permease [Brevibacillus aydinogluensis]NNV04354.1 MFS transporter [Brevibacillus sp. MCWH]UFJ61445.1 MFS transporter [Anoxybacillus sediminis]